MCLWPFCKTAVMRGQAAPGLVGRGPLWAGALGSQLTAAWLVVSGDAHEGEYDVPAFAAFWTQMMLSLAWLLLFFRFRRPALALADVCVLWLATAITVREFARKHRIAAGLVLPYLAWVSYAALVNGRVWWRTR
jgi:benzodiazapine receptor